MLQANAFIAKVEKRHNFDMIFGGRQYGLNTYCLTFHLLKIKHLLCGEIKGVKKRTNDFKILT